MAKASHIPLIFGIKDPAIASSVLEEFKGGRPILYGASEENLSEMAEVAKKYKIPPRWKNLVLFTLKQNIYSDPQVPMQVKQDIYKLF